MKRSIRYIERRNKKARMNFELLTDKQQAAMVLKPLLRPQTLQTVDGRARTVDGKSQQRFLECSEAWCRI